MSSRSWRRKPQAAGRSLRGQKAGHRLDADLGPAATAKDGERTLGGGEQALQLGHRFLRRCGLRGRHGAGVDRLRLLDQHVFWQRQDDRAGAAGHGRGESAVEELGDPRRVLDLGDPLGHAAEHPAVVDLLEGVTLAAAPVDLADEQDHGHAVLLRDVDPGAGVGGAGSAGDHGDARPAGELAPGGRHHRRTTFLAADDEADLRGVVQRVENLEVALARDAEHGRHTERPQLVHQNAPASPHANPPPAVAAGSGTG